MNRLELPYPPSTNRLWRNVQGRMIVSSEAAAFKRLVGQMAMLAGVKIESEADIAVSLVLHPRKPKRAGRGRVRCLDVDNPIKAVLDALQGVAYADDRQVWRVSAERGEPVEGGRLVVVWQIDR